MFRLGQRNRGDAQTNTVGATDPCQGTPSLQGHKSLEDFASSDTTQEKEYTLLVKRVKPVCNSAGDMKNHVVAYWMATPSWIDSKFEAELQD